MERLASKHGVMEGSTKRVRVLDKASAERINAEVADRRESTLMAEDGGGSGVVRKVEFSDAKHESVVYPHFHEFAKNALQRQPRKCESARALEPIRAERSSNVFVPEVREFLRTAARRQEPL